MNEYLFLYAQSGEFAVIVEAETLQDATEIWRKNVMHGVPSALLPYHRVLAVNRVASVARALATSEKEKIA